MGHTNFARALGDFLSESFSLNVFRMEDLRVRFQTFIRQEPTNSNGLL